MYTKPPITPQQISANITLCADGKYRWVYSVNLFKNPAIFWLIWKIFFFIIAGIFSVVLIADTANWGAERILPNLKVMGIVLAGMTALVGLGYLIYAAIMGGKYTVAFTMDEYGVNHAQIPSQAKKAKRIGQAAMIAGAAAGNFGAVGAGIGAQRTEMYSEFAKTKKVKAYPRKHLIKVNGTLEHNQVYAAPEDFEFVKNFILYHCPNLKK